MIAKIVEDEMRRELSSYGIIATDTTAKEAVTARAERFVRRSGYVYQTADEIVEELFGERGMLHPWEDDTELKRRMIVLWTEVRPTGEQLEYDTEQRAKRYRDAKKG
jgi:hypothetical protein